MPGQLHLGYKKRSMNVHASKVISRMYVIPQAYLIASHRNMMDWFVYEIEPLILCCIDIYQYGVAE
jgi:hypothetical protein